MATGKTPGTYASVLRSQHAPNDAPMGLSGPGASTDAHDQHVKIPIEVLLQIGAALSSNRCGRVIDAHADASPTTASREKKGDASPQPWSGFSELSYARGELGGGRVLHDQS
ncbi:hypothetical protein MTO96_033942 [Rhipicephalus appendiculatus]